MFTETLPAPLLLHETSKALFVPQKGPEMNSSSSNLERYQLSLTVKETVSSISYTLSLTRDYLQYSIHFTQLPNLFANYAL